MIFLVQYNRQSGSTVLFRAYPDSALEAAQDDRLELELELNRKGVDDEVVLLDAESEDALRLTHGRYFEDADFKREPVAKTN